MTRSFVHSSTRRQTAPCATSLFATVSDGDHSSEIGPDLSWQHVNLLGEYDFSEERL